MAHLRREDGDKLAARRHCGLVRARLGERRTALFWVKFGIVISCNYCRQGGVCEPIVWDGSESLYCTVGGC